MTDRAITFIQVCCCIAMFSDVIAVEMARSNSVAAIGIGIVIMVSCLWALHRCWQWERQQQLIDSALWQQRVNDFEDDLRHFQRVVQKEYCNLGDQNCLYNARSPYLQCAMHPTGDCAECGDRVSIYFDHPPEPNQETAVAE